MKKINWIILTSEGLGIRHRVGTFIKQLSGGQRRKKNITVYILKIGIGGYHAFEFEEGGGITILQIPLIERGKGTDTCKNQERIARSIVHVALQYISPADINVVHMNYIFEHLIGKEIKQKLESIILFTKHFSSHNEIFSSNYFSTELETYQLVDQIIAVTRHGKDHLTAQGVIEDNLQVIYNGIDPGQFNLATRMNIKEKYGLTGNEYLILLRGRIDQIKGLNYLASAFDQLLRQIADCRLVIACNGDFESLIKATSHFSSHVSFLGFVPFEELVSLYRVVTIGVIPSLKEHCSYVALEMLFCGLSAVATILGSLKEIFIHNKTTFLAHMLPNQKNLKKIASDVAQLAGFMQELLRNEPLRQKFSQHAVKKANATFMQGIMVDLCLN